MPAAAVAVIPGDWNVAEALVVRDATAGIEAIVSSAIRVGALRCGPERNGTVVLVLQSEDWLRRIGVRLA